MSWKKVSMNTGKKNKKIVITPIFCDTHLVRFQIPNIIETIDPDVIVYNEGMFPMGPESSTKVGQEFIKKYTWEGRGNRGFDILELREIVKKAQKKYPTVKIILNEINYPKNETSASKCYTYACSNFEEIGISVNPGDYVFPFEGDVFHHEGSKENISKNLATLDFNEGFKSNWIDFVENQYYVEKYSVESLLNDEKRLQKYFRARSKDYIDPQFYKLNIKKLVDKSFREKLRGRHRKICIRFGDMKYYRSVLMNFEGQVYRNMFSTDLITYHYAWFRKGKYKQLRYDQLNRPPGYWKSFDDAVRKANEFKYKFICVRPNKFRFQNDRYIRYFEIDHPKHIKSHECFLKNISVSELDRARSSNKIFEQN